ncbi:MAG: hypothetical protein IJ191_09260 [Treponema sp.]|nr:hypothetical protein [Treponema sp.]
MVIFFYIPESYIARVLTAACEENGNICTVFPDLNALCTAFTNMIEKPDLVVLDYRLFNHAVFNPYRYLQTFNHMTPLIFYNDPFPEPQRRARHWECTLQTLYFDSFKPESYRSVFSTIAQTVESEQLLPYIPLLQPARTVPSTPIVVPAAPESTIRKTPEQVKTTCKLHDTAYTLLQIFYTLRDKACSVSAFKHELEKTRRPLSIKTIYAHIARLRAQLTAHPELHMNIINTTDGYRLLCL